jgi:hypothetical protein
MREKKGEEMIFKTEERSTMGSQKGELPEGERIAARIVERNEDRHCCHARSEDDQSTKSKRNAQQGEPALLIQVVFFVVRVNLVDHQWKSLRGETGKGL